MELSQTAVADRGAIFRKRLSCICKSGFTNRRILMGKYNLQAFRVPTNMDKKFPPLCPYPRYPNEMLEKPQSLPSAQVNDVSDKVFIVDDDALVRRSLEITLSLAGLKPAKFSSAHQFLAHITFQHSGCVLTDVRMPGMDGLELQVELARRNLPMSVIVMTGHAEVSLAVRAMQAGALDFLEKPFGNELLLTRVGYALDVARKKAKQAALMETNLQKFFSLSSRERDVLKLVVEGHSNKEIARTLGISQRTVDIHRARVMGKMQVTSVAALVRMAAAIL